MGNANEAALAAVQYTDRIGVAMRTPSPSDRAFHQGTHEARGQMATVRLPVPDSQPRVWLNQFQTAMRLFLRLNETPEATLSAELEPRLSALATLFDRQLRVVRSEGSFVVSIDEPSGAKLPLWTGESPTGPLRAGSQPVPSPCDAGDVWRCWARPSWAGCCPGADACCGDICCGRPAPARSTGWTIQCGARE